MGVTIHHGSYHQMLLQCAVFLSHKNQSSNVFIFLKYNFYWWREQIEWKSSSSRGILGCDTV